MKIKIYKGCLILPVYPKCRSQLVEKDEYEIILLPYIKFIINSVNNISHKFGKRAYEYDISIHNTDFDMSKFLINKCPYVINDKSDIEVFELAYSSLHPYKDLTERVDVSCLILLNGKKYFICNKGIFNSDVLKVILPIITPNFNTDYEIYRFLQSISAKDIATDNTIDLIKLSNIIKDYKIIKSM